MNDKLIQLFLLLYFLDILGKIDKSVNIQINEYLSTVYSFNSRHEKKKDFLKLWQSLWLED